jgi:hypothetical protein
MLPLLAQEYRVLGFLVRPGTSVASGGSNVRCEAEM